MPLIIKNTVEYCSTNACGAGIYGGEANPFITNNVIRYNSGTQGAGLGFGHASLGRVINNTIYGNRAGNGGGIYCYDNAHPFVSNCIFWGDTATYNNEIGIANASITITYCDIRGGYGGDGNIDVDPLFRDPENGDLRLSAVICGDSADSPCIDTGDPYSIDFEFGCSAGLGDLRADLGAYGGGGNVTGIDDDSQVLPSEPALLSNYPNPFNGSTVISFELKEDGIARLEIFDITGARVAVLFEGYRTAGRHSVTWDASDLASGLYLCRLQYGENSSMRSMVLVK